MQNQVSSLDENDLMTLYYFTINENFQNYIDNFETTEGADLKTEEEFNFCLNRALTYKIEEPEVSGLYDEFEELL